MYFGSSDTITAQVTASGKAGVGIIRVSGALCQAIALSIIGKLPKPRHATYTDFLGLDDQTIDQGLALYFSAPNSFTGEDVLELHGHGGAVVLDLLLQRTIQLGARLARPGEFSERAFHNNKIDLAQAEAIADLIDAQSQQAARSAIRSLQGVFSLTINEIVSAVIQLRLYVEAAIDFPDEEVDFLSDGKILLRLNNLLDQVTQVLANAKQGATLKEGLKVVIVGHPNAGKSSLLNALSGFDAAIVSDVPGTTRDIVRENILIDGMPLYVLDTAGLRQTNDQIESEGVKRALNEIPNADRILLIIDANQTRNTLINHPLISQFKEHWQRLTVIRNKIDLTGENAVSYQLEKTGITVINLSVKTQAGLPVLKAHLKECAGYQGTDTLFIARRRHLEALNKALYHLNQAKEQLVIYSAGELVAEELRNVQQALSEITGEFRADDLLGKIFSSFCIGK